MFREIESLVVEGSWPPGHKLPSERALVDQYRQLPFGPGCLAQSARHAVRRPQIPDFIEEPCSPAHAPAKCEAVPAGPNRPGTRTPARRQRVLDAC